MTQQYGCILVPHINIVSDVEYIREVSSHDFVTSQPLLPDPYETKMVTI